MDQHCNIMPTDVHHTLPESGPLADYKTSDMPAARTMIYLVAVMLIVFAVIAAVMDRNAALNSPVVPPEVGVEYPIE